VGDFSVLVRIFLVVRHWGEAPMLRVAMSFETAAGTASAKTIGTVITLRHVENGVGSN
jgi:Na+-translocating ferredoxin:NAD+ oxidoreductase RnfA subunit